MHSTQGSRWSNVRRALFFCTRGCLTLELTEVGRSPVQEYGNNAIWERLHHDSYVAPLDDGLSSRMHPCSEGGNKTVGGALHTVKGSVSIRTGRLHRPLPFLSACLYGFLAFQHFDGRQIHQLHQLPVDRRRHVGQPYQKTDAVGL